jgi:ribosomal protein S18 acetylase RimI-like enzyme
LNKKIDYSIHSISDKEIPYLKEYLYKAIFVPPETSPFPKSIIDEEFLKPIYKNWGKEGDIGFAAIDNKSNNIIGMAWVRLYDKENLPFGIIDIKTPALSIAIDKKYRSMGIGTQLMDELINSVKEQGFKGISLSVDNRNFAVKLYKKVGFELYKENKEYNPLYLLKF